MMQQERVLCCKVAISNAGRSWVLRKSSLSLTLTSIKKSISDYVQFQKVHMQVTGCSMKICWISAEVQRRLARVILIRSLTVLRLTTTTITTAENNGCGIRVAFPWSRYHLCCLHHQEHWTKCLNKTLTYCSTSWDLCQSHYILKNCFM